MEQKEIQMESDIVAVLDQCQRLIEKVLLDVSLNKTENLLSDCLVVVNRLNPILTNKDLDDDVASFAIYVLKLYDRLKDKDPSVLSTDEKLLWISSKVNSHKIYPLFLNRLFIDCESPFSDELLPLPQTLGEVSWTRLNDMAVIDWSIAGFEDICQDMSPNCSFVSALLSASANKNIDLRRAITPNKKSPKYGVKLMLNGCYRAIILDDQVPILSLETKSIIARSQSNSSLLWPALLEKAYFKMLKNGYDHEGSNFGIDAYIITGWIPNYCYVCDLTRSMLEQYYELFKKGDMIIGIGSGRLTKEESKFYGILPNHDYSIYDIIKNEDSSFTFVAKNPLQGKDNENRVFKIDDLNLFELIYFNSNPAIYKFEKAVNFLHKPHSFEEDDFYHSPQFSICNKTTAPIEVTLLLERHLIDNEFEVDNYLNVNIYESNGERVWGNTHLKIKKGIENNTRYHASIFTLTEKCTIIVTFKSKAKRLRSFTLKAFSNNDFEIVKAKNLFDGTLEVNGEWWPTNSYGGPTKKDYIKNLQYELYFPSSHSKEVDTTVALISNGILLDLDIFINENPDFKFLTHYDAKNLVVQNNNYQNKKVLYAHLKLRTNTRYILIPSTRDPVDVKVPHLLAINYDSSHLANDAILQPIGTNLGLFNKTLTFNWNNRRKHRVKFSIGKRTVVQIRITSTCENYSEYRSKMRLSIYRFGDHDQFFPIRTNDDFDDNFYGTFVKEDMDAGSYIMIIERADSADSGCQLEVGGNNKFRLSDDP